MCSWWKLQRRRGGTVLFQRWSISRGSRATAEASFWGVLVWRRSVWQQILHSFCLSSCLSYQLFIPFLPEAQRLSPAAEPGWMMVIMWHHSEQKTWALHVFVSFHCCVLVVTVFKNITVRLQWTFPQKTASLPASDSQTASCLLMVIMQLCNLERKT